MPLKFKDVLSMILFLNEEVTYTRKGFERVFKEEANSIWFQTNKA